MRRRFESLVSFLPGLRHGPAFALRETIGEGYSAAKLRSDALAGLVVGIVALPLSMALAIATGVPPQHGLYTAIVAGALIAALGGSRVQVSGPTAAFVVILVPIVERFGIGGLCVATAMAGVILVAMGLARLGQMISFIPSPVTTGFTAGIAVVIATLQVKDFLGLTVDKLPAEYVHKLGTLWSAMPTTRWADFAIGVLTLAILVGWPKVNRKIPSPLVAVAVAAVAAWLLAKLWPDGQVATIASRFTFTLADGSTRHGIPQVLPGFHLPWGLPGPDGAPLHLSLQLLKDLLPSAFAIAILGAIESLLSAVIADGMTGFKHDPDAELMAQGAGNITAPFLGGFAATGAIARTATNVRAGGRSPVAAIVHAAFVLLAVVAIAPLLGYLPMAAMAALLLVVAYNMSEWRHFARLVRVAPRSDVFVLITCFGLTVVFDMVIAVGAGVLLAAILFIRRMAEVSGVKLVGEGHRHADMPASVLLYDIAGPLFFGAAQKAMSAVREAGDEGGVRIVVLDMRDVPAMDATGLVNLESTVETLRKRNVFVILAGVQPQPHRVLERGGLTEDERHLAVFESFEEAIALARTRT